MLYNALSRAEAAATAALDAKLLRVVRGDYRLRILMLCRMSDSNKVGTRKFDDSLTRQAYEDARPVLKLLTVCSKSDLLDAVPHSPTDPLTARKLAAVYPYGNGGPLDVRIAYANESAQKASFLQRKFVMVDGSGTFTGRQLAAQGAAALRCEGILTVAVHASHSRGVRLFAHLFALKADARVSSAVRP